MQFKKVRRNSILSPINYCILSSCTKSYNHIQKRFMLSSAKNAAQIFYSRTPLISPRKNLLSVTKREATISAVRLKKKAAQDLANDNTGTHVHVVKQTCTLDNCANTKCSTLCDQPNKVGFQGHNSHTPPIGRFSRFISNTDANGNMDTQYFVKTNKEVEITENEKHQYGKDIKTDKKHEKFVNQYRDKYDD